MNTDDPTTGRSHFWSVTLDIIRKRIRGSTGLGAFGVVYTQYDSRSGLFRLEQAYNDYLQILSDGGVIGAALALWSLSSFSFDGQVLDRVQSQDQFRRGVALAAVGGCCFAVLIRPASLISHAHNVERAPVSCG